MIEDVKRYLADGFGGMDVGAPRRRTSPALNLPHEMSWNCLREMLTLERGMARSFQWSVVSG